MESLREKARGARAGRKGKRTRREKKKRVRSKRKSTCKLKTENNAKATENRDVARDRQEKRRGAETGSRTGRVKADRKCRQGTKVVKTSETELRTGRSLQKTDYTSET